MSLIANIVLERARNAKNLGISPAISKYASEYSQYPTFLQVIDELCKDKNIWQMMYASDCGRPAIEPVLRTIENICCTGFDFDIFTDDNAKRSLGVIVKIIMEIYGYYPVDNKEIIKGYSKSISHAAVYEPNNEMN